MSRSDTAPSSRAEPGEQPYSGLDPDQVLDALDAVGLRGDGRLIQLNSYENRVFQVFLEDGRVIVSKFYRPGRWSDAQIIEEGVDHDYDSIPRFSMRLFQHVRPFEMAGSSD